MALEEIFVFEEIMRVHKLPVIHKFKIVAYINLYQNLSNCSIMKRLIKKIRKYSILI